MTHRHISVVTMSWFIWDKICTRKRCWQIGSFNVQNLLASSMLKTFPLIILYVLGTRKQDRSSNPRPAYLTVRRVQGELAALPHIKICPNACL